MEHSNVWKAFREQGVEEPHIPLLTMLYDQQRATVHIDAKNKHFHLERGTKQGDPLSTLLFYSLLQYITKPLTGKWMNMKIPPPGGKIKDLGQLITFKNAVQVEFAHRIKSRGQHSRATDWS